MCYRLVLRHKDHVFNLECLSGTNPHPHHPHPPDTGICKKLQNKLEVDLLNIVQLTVAQRREVKLGEPSSSAFFGI